jgi:peptide deformylase
MGLRNIRLENDPILRKKSKEVTEFDYKLSQLVEDMIETMYENDGVGLAAVQVGVLKRVVVIDIYDETGVKVLINPVITHKEGSQTDQEGCLSLPGKAQDVTRPNIVTVTTMDLNGNTYELTGEGLLARALCHELDHLEGILFIDRVVE